MKNTMNKAISFILVAILLLSATPLAYAEDSATYEVGDIIQFGSYPQSEVEDETLRQKYIHTVSEDVILYAEWTKEYSSIFYITHLLRLRFINFYISKFVV